MLDNEQSMYPDHNFEKYGVEYVPRLEYSLCNRLPA